MQVGEFCRGQRKDEDILLILDQDGALELLNDRADPLGQVGGVLTASDETGWIMHGGGAVLGSRGWRRQSEDRDSEQTRADAFHASVASCHAPLCGMSKRTQHSHVCWRARLLIIVTGVKGTYHNSQQDCHLTGLFL